MKRAASFLAVLLAVLAVSASVAGAERILPTNQDAVLVVGPFVSHEDGVTPQNALTVTGITCELYREADGGGAPTRTAITLAASGTSNDMAPVSGTVGGFYSVELTAAQLDFVGRATLAFSAPTLHLPVFVPLRVVPAAVYAGLTGSGGFPSDVTRWKGSAAPDNTGDAYARLGAPAGASVSADIAGLPPAVTSHLDANSTQIQAILDDLGGMATEAQVASAVLDAAAANHAQAGTIGAKIGQIGPSITVSQVASAVLDAPAASHEQQGSIGAKIGLLGSGGIAPTAAEIVATMDASSTQLQAILDDLGSMATEEQVAEAILNTALAGYSTAGTVGRALSDAANAVNAPTVEEIDAYLSAQHGAGLWTVVTDGGSINYPYTLTTAAGTPIANALVEVSTDPGKTNVIRSGLTDVFGVVTFRLDPGTYYFWSTKAGVQFVNPTQELVE